MGRVFKKTWLLCRLATLRTAHNLRQKDLAKALGVSRQTIIAVETHKTLPSIPLALKMAKYFDITVEDLFVQKES